MRLKLLATLAIAIAVVSTSQAQTTYTWNGGAGNGNWNDSGNWTGGLPVSGPNIIEFNNTTQTATIQNISNPFQLNQLNMLVDASNGFSVSGSALQFVGSGAQISNQASGAGTQLVINTPLEFLADINFDISQNNASGAEIRLNGPITAAPGRTISTQTTSAPGTLLLLNSPNPNFQGTLAVTANTIVQTSANDTLTRVANVTANGGATTIFAVGNTSAAGIPETGVQLQFGSFAGGGQLQIGGSTGASTALVGFNNGVTSGLDTVSGTLAMGNVNSHLAKVGTGEWRFTGSTNSSLLGTLSVRDGLLNFQGSSSQSGGLGSTGSTGAIHIYAGAEVRETLTGTGSNGRLGNTQPVTLFGGLLRLDAAGLGTSTSGFSDVVGPLRAGAGQSTIQIDVAANRGARFSFASLSVPDPTATLYFQSNNLGTGALNTAGSGNVNFVTAPTGQLVGGTTTYDPNTQNLSILPYGFSSNVNPGQSPSTFVTFDAANASIRGLADTNYAADFTGAATNNVSLSAATNVDSATTANALRIASGGSLANSSTLTLTAGALLNTGTNADITGAGTLQFGAAGDRTAFITTVNTFNISNAISAANLAKSGPGLTVLTGATTLNGTTGNVVAANAGTLALGAGSSVTTSNALSATNPLSFEVSRGATLDVVANGLQLASFTNLAGQGVVAGNVTVGNSGAANGTSGAITPTALAGNSPGVLTVAGDLVFQQGGNYNWFLSSVQGGQYTQSQIAVTGNLDLSSLSGTNQFTIRPTSLLLSNSGTGNVYDFDQNTPYQWTLVTASGTINGFTPDKFVVDTADFGNSLQPGWTFTVDAVGSTLVLNYAPIPEPGVIFGLSAAVLTGAMLLRRRRKQLQVSEQECLQA